MSTLHSSPEVTLYSISNTFARESEVLGIEFSIGGIISALKSFGYWSFSDWGGSACIHLAHAHLCRSHSPMAGECAREVILRFHGVPSWSCVMCRNTALLGFMAP